MSPSSCPGVGTRTSSEERISNPQGCAWEHRRMGNFLPGGAVNHLPKKFSQVAQIFTKQSLT